MEELLALEEPRPVRLTVDDFLLLADAGALDGYRRTELIEGVIVEMAPMSTRHSLLTTRLLVALELALRAMKSPLSALGAPTLSLSPGDAPEPDIVVARPGGERYLPGAAALLVIEVSMATLRHDLTVKRDLYARGGVPEYWVVDVEGGQVHQFRGPRDGAYADTGTVPLSATLASTAVPGLRVDGAGL